MGDLDGGSLIAAQSAQGNDPKQNSRPRGFFGRLFSKDGPNRSTQVQSEKAGEPKSYDALAAATPGMLNLRSMHLDDVAIPKSDIVAVPEEIKKDDLVSVFSESGLTRIPVYTDTLDTPIGFVHLKDFALKHGFNSKGSRYNLREMVRPLLFAPPSMPIGILLQNMQNERSHMALVIDEYGGVDGLVTIEDLIEQVIGEIEDEHDIDEGVYWAEEKPGCYLVQAKAPLDEFEAKIGMRLTSKDEDEEIETLGGLVVMLIGRVPVRGEVISHPAGPEFEIVDADLRRVKRIRVRTGAEAKNG